MDDCCATLSPEKRIGFVPTMGNLHQGHASLFTRSSQENVYTVSSLFINPTQFNQLNDYFLYPKTLEADIALMEQNGVDFCILPRKEEMYADEYRYQMHETELTQLMEGKHRPGHFNGVLTVVLKLLHLTRPNSAYFGEKDYQQYLLIKDMVAAFFMNVAIVPCPTVREESGLAFSSRNNRLNPEQRLLAEEFARVFHQHKPCAMIKEELHDLGIQVDYVEEHFNRRFAAIFIHDIRLIDNYALG